MFFCIDAKQLRAALAEIEAAEKNGFHHCLAVFRLARVGNMLDACRADYSDLLERASDTDKSLDWGRFQGVSRKFTFDGAKLAPIDRPAVKGGE